MKSLKHGDVVEVLTSKAEGAGPSREWLEFVKSPRARTKIRQWFAKERREDAIDADRTWKKKYGDPLDLLVAGDSIAAGLGAERRKQTLGARLSSRLAKATGRSVRLRTVAVVGSESSALAGQLATLPASYRPDLAVIVVGGNDVTHRVAVSESIAHLEAAIADLHHRAHEACFIANSVTTEVKVEA